MDIVLVNKGNEKWQMQTNYIDLNKVCPKDVYPLPSVDQLVDISTRHEVSLCIFWIQSNLYTSAKQWKDNLHQWNDQLLLRTHVLQLENVSPTYQCLIIKKKQKLPTRQIHQKHLKSVDKLIVYKFIDGFLSSSVITDRFTLNLSINPSINLVMD